MKTIVNGKTLFGVLVVLGSAGVALGGSWPSDAKPFGQAVLESKSGSKVAGTVEFAKSAKGALMVRANITGAAPGDHGFHIHSVGDCSDAEAKKAGDHFNPTGDSHGDPHASKHHAGDLGNVVVDGSGKANFEVTLAAPSQHGFKGWDEVVGKSVVFHETKDDLKSQPAGASGKRVACGVIKSVDAPPK